MMEWRKPPQERFVHLFIRGERLSLCGRVSVAGQKIKDLDPSKELHGANKLNTALRTCPLCRRIVRNNG